MRIAILASVFGVTFSGLAMAQNVPTAPTSGIDTTAIRMSCRDEAVAKGLKDGERGAAVRACIKAKLPEGYALDGRPSPKMVREECRSEANGKGLKGPEKRAAVQKCFADKRPDLAKAESCRKDAKEKGLQGEERKAAVKACRTAA